MRLRILCGALCLVGCGGSDGAPSGTAPGGSDASATDATTGGDAGGNGDAGDADAPTGDGADATPIADASAATDAADVADADGGGPSDPGSVSCGASSCSTATQVCCSTFTSDFNSPITSACTAPTACSGAEFAERCDEAADCAPGQVCCGGIAGPTPLAGFAACSALPCSIQLCKTDAECASGSCKLATCGPLTLQTCGLTGGCH